VPYGLNSAVTTTAAAHGCGGRPSATLPVVVLLTSRRALNARSVCMVSLSRCSTGKSTNAPHSQDIGLRTTSKSDMGARQSSLIHRSVRLSEVSDSQEHGQETHWQSSLSGREPCSSTAFPKLLQYVGSATLRRHQRQVLVLKLDWRIRQALPPSPLAGRQGRSYLEGGKLGFSHARFPGRREASGGVRSSGSAASEDL
jgi:hypothetical protein